MRRRPTAVAIALASVAALCAALVSAGPAAARPQAEWKPLHNIEPVVDIAGPRSDGSFIVAGGGGLLRFEPGSAPTPFAAGPGGYAAPAGEPYIALSRKHKLGGAGCSFRRDDVYALEPSDAAIVRITREGTVERFAQLPVGSFVNGITFDQVGKFGGRLLVNAVASGHSTVYAIDCAGNAKPVVEGAPSVEGGMVIAPRGIHRLGGRMIAVDEFSGRVYAFSHHGSVRVIANSGLPTGADVGVESIGFVPSGFGHGDAAYLSDDRGAVHLGAQSALLSADGGALRSAGVRPGDLLAATETGARTIRIRCGHKCKVARVAGGEDLVHGEGHIEFGPAP